MIVDYCVNNTERSSIVYLQPSQSFFLLFFSFLDYYMIQIKKKQDITAFVIISNVITWWSEISCVCIELITDQMIVMSNSTLLPAILPNR